MIKFLIIRFSSIGDIVLTSPVVRCLKEQVEDSSIHYLTKPGFNSIVKNNPNIDKVFLLKTDLSQTLEELKNEKYDYIIDLHHNLRTLRIKQRLKVLSFSFNKLNKEKWLLVNFKINKLPRIHIVDRYLDTVQLFEVKNDEKGLDYFIPEDEEFNTEALPENFKTGYVAFAIGGQHYTKKLPTNKIIDLCSKLSLPIVLLGGKDDVEAAETVTKTVGSSIYNACGKLSINESADAIKKAKVVITHDTGLMHIAAAFKKKIVSIWGNTVPELGMGPYMVDDTSQIFEIKDLKCRPCSKIGFKECPKKHFDCMNQLDIDDIAMVVKSLKN